MVISINPKTGDKTVTGTIEVTRASAEALVMSMFDGDLYTACVKLAEELENMQRGNDGI